MNSGAIAENLAVRFLQRQGLRILERNFRCRSGEIDVIACDRDTLVFVEVRLREPSVFGGAVQSITTTKQNRLRKAARYYLGQQSSGKSCRFDAILLDRLEDSRIEWLKNIIEDRP